MTILMCIVSVQNNININITGLFRNCGWSHQQSECNTFLRLLSQSAQHTATVQMAGDDTDLPEDLAKAVDEDEEEEETNDSFLNKL